MPFQITNRTKNIALAKNAKLADNPLKRIKGLLGKSNMAQDEALIIRPCNAVHTFFMRFSIDVVFVNSANKIVKIIHDMAPFRISSIYWQACFVIEFPAGAVSKTPSQAGDIISIEPSA